MSAPPIVAVVAAGAMGAAVARRLTSAGCTVLTTLQGRSAATRKRAREAGMEDVSLGELARRAQWVLSILPPSEAEAFAGEFRKTYERESSAHSPGEGLVFADCNAVSPETVKRIRAIFSFTETSFVPAIRFIDAGIIGGPPREGYDPTFYASAAPDDARALDAFEGLQKYGLKISALRGEGASIGDASALKMSYAVGPALRPSLRSEL